MWSSRLFWRLFSVYAGLNLTLALGFLVLVTVWQRTEANTQVEQRLHDTAIVVRSHVSQLLSVLLDENVAADSRSQAARELQALIKQLSDETGTRLTLVDADGEVLADSERDPATMMNHANRPELIAASETGEGTATRQSPTLGVEMLYLALSTETENGDRAYIRAAIHIDTINRQIAAIRRVLWLFALIVGAVAVGLTYAMVGKIIYPLATLTERAQSIASGKKQDFVRIDGRDEIGLLAGALDQMQQQLEQRFAQLREKNTQMATVLSSMEEGLISVDANEQVLLANDAAKALLGFSTDGDAGQPPLARVPSQPLRNVVRQCLRDGRSVQIEFESQGPLPRDLAVRANCLPGDPPPGVVVVLHDNTELRRFENHRREFVANVSHELKTPLAAIKAYAETLRLGAVNDAENNLNFVARIEEQADRLHQLILDMLQIARIEAGEEVFDITEVSINQVVSACVAHHFESAERKHITLTVERPDETVCVKVDAEGLRAILDNLVDNAIKYTNEGGSVTLRWHAEDSLAVLEVEDTGIGIAEAHQARVFERFYRVDKARSRELGGTGLGLSIVKRLSQSFGGSVHLMSQPGEGSTFQIRLPRN